MRKAWMHRVVFVLLLMAFLCAQGVGEEQKERLVWNGLEYELNAEGIARILEFSGEQEEVVIPSTIGNAAVAEVGEGAFKGNQSIQSIFIEEGVQSIGEGAFQGCNALKNVILPESMVSLGASAFSGCSSLLALDLPEGLKSVGEGCFSESGLREITIPGGVERISRATLSKCDQLTRVEIEEGVLSIGARAFSGCKLLSNVQIPYSLTSIGSFAFENCRLLQSIDFTENLVEIGENPFFYCTGLKKIAVSKDNAALVYEDGMLIDQENRRLIACLQTNLMTSYQMPDNLIEIGGYAFAGCRSLKQIKLSDRLQTIGRGAFYGCERITSVDIPAGVKQIGTNPFEYCLNLKSLILPSKNKYFKYEDGMLIDIENRSIIYGMPRKLISRVLIPEGIEHIGDMAFKSCALMEELVIPDGVTTIGDYAFFECLKLKRVVIASELESVGENAFMDGRNYKPDSAGWMELTLYGIDITVGPMLYLEQDGAALDYAIEHRMDYILVDPLAMAAMIWGKGNTDNSIEMLSLLKENRAFECSEKDILLYEDKDVQVTVTGISFLAGGKARAILEKEQEGPNAWALGIQIVVDERSQCSASVEISERVLIDEYAMEGILEAPELGRYCMVSVLSSDPFNRITKLSDIGKIVLANIRVTVDGEERAVIGQEAIEVSARKDESTYHVDIGEGSLEYVIDNEEMRIVGYSGTGSLVTIPEKVENRTFTAIDNGAFRDCKRIVIPSSIRRIGEKAIDNPESVIVEVYPESYADAWAEEQGIKRQYIPSSFEKDGLIWEVLDGQLLQVIGMTEEREILEIPGRLKDMQVVGIQGRLSSNTLTKVMIGEGVQIIGERAFSESYSLTEVVLPQSLIEIGDNAFEKCEKLQIIGLPEMLGRIGEKAFLDCKGIGRLDIGEKVVSIGEGAFSGMVGLTAVEVAENNPIYSDSDGVLFHKDGSALMLYPSARESETYQVPIGVERIEQEAIAHALYLKEIEIPSTVREIGDGVLYDMPQLANIVLNEGIERIGNDALKKCPQIIRLDIPRSVNAVGSNSLSRMDGLQICFFEEGVEQIGDNVLRENPQMVLVYLPGSLKEIGYGFASCGAEKTTYLVVEDGSYAQQWIDEEKDIGHIWMIQIKEADEQNVVQYEDERGRRVYCCVQNESVLVFYVEEESVILMQVYANEESDVWIPETVGGMPVSAVGEHAFKHAERISSIALPKTLERVGKEAFSSLESLTSITIPESVVQIDEGAFRGTGIIKLTIPGSVKVIRKDVAAWMGDLKEVVIEEGVQEIQDGAFDGSFPERVTLPASLERMSGTAFNSRETKEFVVVKGSRADELCKAYEYSCSYQKQGNSEIIPFEEVEGEIIFPNSQAEAIVRYALGGKEGAIYAEDVKNIREISFNGMGISSIDFLKHFTGLKRLCIGSPAKEPEWSWLRETGINCGQNNTFTDLTPITGLQQLEELDISFCDVSDLSALANLSNLKDLTMRYVHVDDYSPLGGLERLERLVLWQSGITDISFLSGLENLKYLDLSETNVTSLLPLKQLCDLEFLHLMDCPDATDYDVLLEMPSLQEVWCYEPEVEEYKDVLGDRLMP